MAGENKVDEIEIVLSSIMDVEWTLSIDNFDSYDHESTKISIEKLHFNADIDCGDVGALFPD